MANTNRNNNDSKEAVMVGAGLAALLAGAYFFLGPDGKKHQRKMRGWMVKMKGEVLEKIEDAKEVTQPIYNEIVDTVAHANQVAGKIPQTEIAALAADLKRQWKNINRTVKGNKPATKRTARPKSAAKSRSARAKSTKSK